MRCRAEVNSTKRFFPPVQKGCPMVLRCSTSLRRKYMASLVRWVPRLAQHHILRKFQSLEAVMCLAAVRNIKNVGRYPPSARADLRAIRDAGQTRKKKTRTIFRDQKLNANSCVSNFSGTSGISWQISRASRPKVRFPWVLKDIPNFLAPEDPTTAEENRIKKFGFGFLFLP